MVGISHIVYFCVSCAPHTVEVVKWDATWLTCDEWYQMCQITGVTPSVYIEQPCDIGLPH